MYVDMKSLLKKDHDESQMPAWGTEDYDQWDNHDSEVGSSDSKSNTEDKKKFSYIEKEREEESKFKDLTKKFGLLKTKKMVKDPNFLNDAINLEYAYWHTCCVEDEIKADKKWDAKHPDISVEDFNLLVKGFEKKWDNNI